MRTSMRWTCRQGVFERLVGIFSRSWWKDVVTLGRIRGSRCCTGRDICPVRTYVRLVEAEYCMMLWEDGRFPEVVVYLAETYLSAPAI